MADAFIQVPPQSTGLKVDTTELTVGANVVERERMNIADPANAAGLSSVLNATPVGTEYGIVTRNVGYNDNAASGAAPAGALSMAWDSVNAKIRALKVDINQNLLTSAPSIIDPNNSTTTVLGANGVFTGTGTDLLPYKALTLTIFADQNSAAGGASVQFSQNSTNWDLTETYTVTANTAITNFFTIRARFFRLVYTNGTVAQGAFRVQALLHPAAVGPRLASISQAILALDEALTTHSVISGLNAGGGGNYVDVKVNPSGTLATQDNSDTTLGSTTAPATVMVAGGKTNDGTPQFQPVPEGAGGRSVIVEGFAGGTAVPVSGTVNQGTASVSTAGWYVLGSTTAESTAAWTSSTTVNSVVALSITGYSSVTVSLNQGSTITGGVVTFEVSDTVAGTNWYPIQGSQIQAFTAGSTYTLQQSVNQAFEFDASGFVQFRVRLSTVITGTGTVNVGVIAAALPDVPVVTVGGTVTANQGGAPWSQNLTQVASTTLGTPQTFGTAPTGVVIGTSSDVYVAGTRARSNQTTTAAGVLDNNLVGVAGTTVVTAAAGVQKVGVVGNAGATLDVAQGGATAATNAVQIAGVFNTTQPTLTAGQGGAVALTSRAAQIVGTGADTFNVTVNAALPAGGNTIGKIDILGNAGATLDQANGSAVPTNGLMVGGGSVAGATNFTTLTVKAASTAAAATDTSLVVQPLVGSHTMNTAAAGTQLVGIVGNAAATLDATLAAGTAPTNGLGVLSQYNTTIPAATAAQTLALQSDTTGAQYVNIAGRKRTYSAMNAAPATSTTDVSYTAVAGDIATLSGNATTTVRVTRVEVSISTSGTAGFATVQLIKRSTADTAGTSTTMAAVPHDANFAAANSTALLYTAAPTVGTAVGAIRAVRFFDESATVPGSATWIWEFGCRGGASEIVLRGTAQQLNVNIPAVISTQSVTVSYEWTEDNS